MNPIGKSVADHWYLVLGAWYVWRFLETERTARREEARARKEDERKARDEQRAMVRDVVREELAAHVREESTEFRRFGEDIRRDLASVTELARQHEERIRDLERPARGRGKA